ncbi:MAG: hypothetical protein J2O48_10125 [Solirubrobacterales bacterium]|nr:hypothetical protein [Solirubrobacterales bacterium]
MVEINRHVRNIVILLVIAGLVDVVPAGGAASNTALQFLYIAFLGAFAWICTRLYREHRSWIYGLGEKRRAVGYVAVGVAALTLTATNKLWATGPGGIAWILLLCACAYAIFEVVRGAQRY